MDLCLCHKSIKILWFSKEFLYKVGSHRMLKLTFLTYSLSSLPSKRRYLDGESMLIEKRWHKTHVLSYTVFVPGDPQMITIQLIRNHFLPKLYQKINIKRIWETYSLYLGCRSKKTMLPPLKQQKCWINYKFITFHITIRWLRLQGSQDLGKDWCVPETQTLSYVRSM